MDALVATLHWSLPDWLTVIGFPAVGVGLILSLRHIREIKKAASAAEEGAKAARAAAEDARRAAMAAEEAISRTERKIADQNVLMLIAQTQRLADDLERAKVVEDTVRLCSEWIGTASELQGILQAGDGHDQLIAALERSIVSAGDAKNTLIEKHTDVAVATAALRHDLIEVRAASSRIIGRMRAYTGETPNA